jgi:hypothetical protein
MEKYDPEGEPLPAWSEKYGLQPHSRDACHAPKFFKSPVPKRRRISQDCFQLGVTRLSFSILNSTCVLVKRQEAGRDKRPETSCSKLSKKSLVLLCYGPGSFSSLETVLLPALTWKQAC